MSNDEDELSFAVGKHISQDTIVNVLLIIVLLTLAAIVFHGSGWVFALIFLVCAAVVRLGILKPEFESLLSQNSQASS